MNRRLALLVALVALAAGVAAALLWSRDAPTETTPRPNFSLTDLDGQTRHATDWDGQLVVIDFWATWCTPCLAEIPHLIQAQSRFGDRGLQILGPALDDADVVREFVARRGLNYPVLLGETAIVSLMDALGDELGALPFTAVINRSGQVVDRHWGALTPEQLEALIERHL